MTLKKVTYKRLIYCLLIGLILWFLTAFLSAKYLTRTNQIDIEEVSVIDGYKVESLNFKTIDNVNISSWYLRNTDPTTIILLSGIKGNRTGQLKRAKFYLELGFSVLMPDLRGTGKSEGDFISFGWHERKDLQACINKLQELGVNNIAADGQSLGAATIVYSFIETDDLDFIILESCYDNISNAFRNRVEKFKIPMFLFEPVKYFIEKIMQEPQSSLSPDKLISKIKCPILIMAGDQENQIPTSETIKLYDYCGSLNKSLHLFKGGKHEDLYERFPLEYEKVVTNFIKKIKN